MVRRATLTQIGLVRIWRTARPHFRMEEGVPLPAYARQETLERRGAGLSNELGTRLNEHVPLEERVLFRLIEGPMPVAESAAVAGALAAQARRPSGPHN